MAAYDHVSNGTSVDAFKLLPDRIGLPEWASSVSLIYEEGPNGSIIFSGRTAENGQWLVKTEDEVNVFEDAEFNIQYVAA